jgi:hypothetical protein
MDHLGIRQFCSSATASAARSRMKLMERAPDRTSRGHTSQPIGHRPEKPNVMYDSGRDVWAPNSASGNPTCPMETSRSICTIFTARGPTSCTASRATLRATCQTPDAGGFPTTPMRTHIKRRSIRRRCAECEVTVYPWNNPPELKARTIARAATS